MDPGHRVTADQGEEQDKSDSTIQVGHVFTTLQNTNNIR